MDIFEVRNFPPTLKEAKPNLYIILFCLGAIISCLNMNSWMMYIGFVIIVFSYSLRCVQEPLGKKLQENIAKYIEQEYGEQLRQRKIARIGVYSKSMEAEDLIEVHKAFGHGAYQQNNEHIGFGIALSDGSIVDITNRRFPIIPFINIFVGKHDVSIYAPSKMNKQISDNELKFFIDSSIKKAFDLT